MSDRLLPYRGIEPPEHINEPWENALFEAQTQAEVDHALLMKRNAMHASALEFGDVEGHDFHGNQWTGGLGGQTVDDFLAEHPRLPGEDVFVWQGRIVAGLPKETQSELIFKTRERYEPVSFVREGANRFCAEHGLPPLRDDIVETRCDIKEAEEVARYFEETPDQSDDPEVQAAYADFRAQSEEQWDFMTRPESEGGLGIKVDFTKETDPYPSAEAQAADLRDNHHITLQSGLGGAHEATMTEAEYDRFRAVHDVFGHAGIGGGFDRHGEYEAWLAHAAMYTGAGRDAMSTEYHGVNSALWSGDPGTPGTGKSILLPESMSNPPWEDPVTAAASLHATSAQQNQLIKKLGLDAEWATKFSKAPWHTPGVLIASIPLEFGDVDGHPFHGNQYTGGFGGGRDSDQQDGTASHPFKTADVEEAAELISRGLYVQLPPQSVSILLDKLAKSDDKSKVYDLCKISVENSNLFCVESQGIPRIQMPQLSTDSPEPGSLAAELEPNKYGEVEIIEQFKQQLKDDGYNFEDVTVPASQLKPTQNELNGAKVAALEDVIARGEMTPGRVFVSNDNYVLDGHHRWAAEVAYDYSDTKLGDVPMDVTRVDLPISVLLDYSKSFAKHMGVPQAAVASAWLDIVVS